MTSKMAFVLLSEHYDGIWFLQPSVTKYKISKRNSHEAQGRYLIYPLSRTNKSPNQRIKVINWSSTYVKNIGMVNSIEWAFTLRNILLLGLSFRTSRNSKQQIPFAEPAAYEMLMLMSPKENATKEREVQAGEDMTQTSSLK